MRFSTMSPILLVVAAASCAGSASRLEPMRPTERNEAETRNGTPEALYQLQDDSGQKADVKVWSGGAYRAKVAGHERTVVHVAFEIENTLGTEIKIDRNYLTVPKVDTDDKTVQNPPLAAISGPEVIAPGTHATVGATFVMPTDIKPQEVDSFDVRWKVASEGEALAEFTTFTQDDYDDNYLYYEAYYWQPYPYWYGARWY